MILKLLILLFIISVIWILFTQIFSPLWHSRPAFPMFRGEVVKARETLTDARMHKYIAKHRVLAAKEETKAAEYEMEANEMIEDAYGNLVERKQNTNG